MQNIRKHPLSPGANAMDPGKALGQTVSASFRISKVFPVPGPKGPMGKHLTEIEGHYKAS